MAINLEKFKISLITATLNSSNVIERAITSVNQQTYGELEHVFIDGFSADDTVSKIKALSKSPHILRQAEPNGIYPALNLGAEVCTGDIIGLLHSDDKLYSVDILQRVAETFEKHPNIDFLYANVLHKKSDSASGIHRKFVCGTFTKKKLEHGWMPPHPSIFIKREALRSIGPYDTSFKIAADYDFVLRLFRNKELNSLYVNMHTHIMYSGGASQASFSARLRKMTEDYEIAKRYVSRPAVTLALKNLRKFNQFF